MNILRKYRFQVLFLFVLLFNTSFAGGMNIPYPVSDITVEFPKHNISQQEAPDYSFIETGEHILIAADTNFSKFKNDSGKWLNRLGFFYQEEQLKYLVDCRFILLNFNSLNIIFPFHYFW